MDCENNTSIGSIGSFLNEREVPMDERVDLVNLLDTLMESESIFQAYAYSDSVKRFLQELNGFAKEKGLAELRPRLELTDKTSLKKLFKKDIFIILKDLQNRNQITPEAQFFNKRRYSTLNLWPLSYVKVNKQKEDTFRNIRELIKGRGELTQQVLQSYERKTLDEEDLTRNLEGTIISSGLPPNGSNANGAMEDGFSTPVKSTDDPLHKRGFYTDICRKHRNTTRQKTRLRHRSASPYYEMDDDDNSTPRKDLVQAVKRNIFDTKK